MPASEELEEEDASDPDEDEAPVSNRRFAILLVRDILVAVAIVGVALGVIVAYAGVWPPMVVVESGSMQHGNDRSYLGVIDTGDLVLVQSISGDPGSVTTYVDGRATGYETYSNYGDVIVFHPPGASPSATPIIHRALVYVVYPSGVGAGLVDIPSLSRFPVTEWSGTDALGQPTTSTLGLRTLTLRVRSFDTGSAAMRTLPTFNFSGVTGSGFLTKGDNNQGPEGLPPVPASAIIGKARGEFPWFGLIKLTVAPGSSGCCPSGWGATGLRGAPKNSWDSLTVSLLLIAPGVLLADQGFVVIERWYHRFQKRRKGEPAPAEAQAAPEDPPEARP